MPYSRFFSLKWQVFTITSALSLLVLMAIITYWQVSLHRAEILSREEDQKTAALVVDTVYPVWQEQTVSSTDMIAQDQRVRHLLAKPDSHNHADVKQLLAGLGLSTGADFFVQIKSKSHNFSAFHSLPSLGHLNDTIYSSYEHPVTVINCHKDGKCWKFITVPVLFEETTVGNVTAGFPITSFFAMIKGGRIPTNIATFSKSDQLPVGWKIIDSSALKLPAGFHLAGYVSPQGHLGIIQSSIKTAGILGGVAFILMQLFIITLLIKRLSYVKMLESGFAMMLLGKTETLREHLIRKSRFRFIDELDKIGETMVSTGEKLNELRAKEEKAAEDRARFKITEYMAEERKQLLAKFAKAEEEMRQSLARELHDEVGARLVSMKVDLSSIKRMSNIPEGVLERVARVERNCLFLNNFLHNTIESLTPTVVGDFGLAGSINGLVREWESSLDGRICFKISMQSEMHDIPFAQATAAYRIVQESITNVAKYSEAQNVIIKISRKPSKVSSDTILIDIFDDGKGFDTGALPRGSGRGIQGIKDRARGFGGTVKIKSKPGEGTRIQCLLPIAPDKHCDDLIIDPPSHIFIGGPDKS